MKFVLAFDSALFVIAGIASFWMCYLARKYALSRSILDYPNERSSHSTPVPRGGGVAIAITFLGLCAALAGFGMIATTTAVALIGGGSVVSVIGWIDDRLGGVGRLWRFGVHLFAGIFAVAWLGGVSSLRLGSAEIVLGPIVGSTLAVLCVVWSINLFNFMDGIDGLAAGEAVSVGLAGALLTIALFGQNEIATLGVAAAGSAAGFLAWNWPPAKIFMGDVGSGFLGFVFAILALLSELHGALPATAWLLLAGVFVLDSTATLLRRVWRREQWYAAHRSHAYQRLVSYGYSHRFVTSAIIVMNYLLAALTFYAFSAAGRLAIGAMAALLLLASAYMLVEWINPMRVARPSPKKSPTR